MSSRKLPNRFSLQESGPVLLLVVVVVIGASFWLSRKEKKAQEFNPSSLYEEAAFKESDNLSEETFLEASPSSPQTSAVKTAYLSGQAAGVHTPSSNAPSSVSSVSPSSVSSLDSMSQSQKAYTIQIFSFQEMTRAQLAQESLLKAGFSSYVLKKDLKEKGVWFRVCSGEFTNKSQAEEKLAEVKQKYKDSFVILR